MIIVDAENRRVVIDMPSPLGTKDISTPLIINEFEKVNKVFLEKTKDKYECELLLVDVEVQDENMKPTGEFVTKAFGKRVGYSEWLIEFNLENFYI